MYIVWDGENNCCNGVPINFPPEDSNENWLPLVFPPARTSTVQTMEFELIGGSVVGKWVGSPDPLDNPASIDEIKARQVELELLPIDVGGFLIDCDDRSEKFMRDALDTWDFRPLDAGVFDDLNGVRVIHWRGTDNVNVPITKQQLIDLYAGMKLARANRAQRLWREAIDFKASGCTMRDLQSWA